jgi:hypothetical protein
MPFGRNPEGLSTGTHSLSHFLSPSLDLYVLPTSMIDFAMCARVYPRMYEKNNDKIFDSRIVDTNARTKTSYVCTHVSVYPCTYVR